VLGAIALPKKEMNTKQSKNDKKDAAQMYPLIRRYEQSDQSRAEFCKEENIKPHVFQYWLGKYRKENNVSQASSSFVALQVESSLGSVIESGIVRITLPSGIIIEIPSQ
jgi:transposase-like protein